MDRFDSGSAIDYGQRYKVEAAAAKPGSGRVQPAQAEARKVLDRARARAGSTDPTRVLEALKHELPQVEHGLPPTPATVRPVTGEQAKERGAPK